MQYQSNVIFTKCVNLPRFMAEYGRDWLHYKSAARLAMVVGSRNVNGLKMFDPRMVWQVMSAIMLVCGAGFGAFILSCTLLQPQAFPKFRNDSVSGFTPTVGLGCRSGGYLIYMIVALKLVSMEALVWWMTHETTHTHFDPLHRLGSRLEQRFRNDKDLEYNCKRHKIVKYLQSNAFRDVARNMLLRPLEVHSNNMGRSEILTLPQACNTIWLIYRLCAGDRGVPDLYLHGLYLVLHGWLHRFQALRILCRPRCATAR